jgi:ubiquinone/menaquinone biosynthesis C-methylase UbiE
MSNHLPDRESVVRHQAEHHFLMQTDGFRDIEELCLHLRHKRAYEIAGELCSGGVVLDLGCNNGYGSAHLALSAKQVIGADVSSRALAEATSRFRLPQLEFVRFDGFKLPFPDGTFDVVTSFQVIEHIADYESYLSEIHRVLKPSGFAVLTTPNARMRLYEGQQPWNSFHVREFTAAELDDLLARYFKASRVVGLTASSPMYEVERNRVWRQRDTAVKNDRAVRWRARTVGLLRAALPSSLIERLRALERVVGVPAMSAQRQLPDDRLAPSVVAKHSTSEFFLSCDDVGASIDLFAICVASGQLPSLECFIRRSS